MTSSVFHQLWQPVEESWGLRTQRGLGVIGEV